ncbi:MAG: STAS domain-containing protein [Planctomycetia bacterium]|nr:STAS domain-containing protein [Planctomycetia bacterium]
MEIQTQQHDSLTELLVQGVLDNTWADHLEKAIDEVARGRSHRLLLNLNKVTYLSSAGISVLLKAHAQFQKIHGFFGVSDPSAQVRQILKLTGLEQRLICDADVVRRSSGTMLVTSSPEYRCVALGDVDFEMYDLDPQTPLRCRTFGQSERLANRSFPEDSSRRVPFVPETFGLGVGAFGGGFADCRERFGEFLAVAGAAVQQPAQAGAAPDYQLAREDFVPVVELLYGLQCTGDFSHLARFERYQAGHTIVLSSLVEQCLTLAAADVLALVIVAESAGLVGAALRRSPATAQDAATRAGNGDDAGLFSHPAVRDWLSFSPERVFPRSLALVAGIAARVPVAARAAALAPLLRPIDAEEKLAGHFHAAPFPFAPLKKRRLNLQKTVESLFDAKEPQGVLHLLGDFRQISGAGESQFVSGACWMAPLADIAVEG